MYRFYSGAENKNRVSVVGRYSEGILTIAVSRCSNKDHFFRKKGRYIAEGRLEKGKTYLIKPLEFCDVKTFVDIAKQVAYEVSINKKVIS